jgi:hypothetical protein
MRRLLLALACASAAACSRGGAEARAGAPPAAQAPASSAGIPHGDHNPHFGGIVLMNGDLHFEVVLRRDGQYRLYFSDAVRTELPAATAAGATITISQKARPPEVVPLQIDDNGESWVGSGHRIDDPDATARVAYTIHGQPYFIDVPVPR